MKKLIIIAGFILALVGCVQTPPQVQNVIQESKKIDSPTPEPAKIKIITGKMNETIETENAKYTINATRTDSGNEFVKPDEGKIYFLIDLTIENKTQNELTIQTSQLILNDDSGYAYNYDCMTMMKQKLFPNDWIVETKILPNKKQRGEIGFTPQINSKNMELQINESKNQKILINLDR